MTTGRQLAARWLIVALLALSDLVPTAQELRDLELGRTLLFNPPDIERILVRRRAYSGEIQQDVPATNRLSGPWNFSEGALGTNDFYRKVLFSLPDTNQYNTSRATFLAGAYSGLVWSVQGPELISDSQGDVSTVRGRVIRAALGGTDNPALAVASSGLVSLAQVTTLGLNFFRPGSFRQTDGTSFVGVHFDGTPGSGAIEQRSSNSWLRIEFARSDWLGKGVGRLVCYVRFAEPEADAEIPPYKIVYGWIRNGRWKPTEEIEVVEIRTSRGKGLGEICNPARFANPAPIRAFISNGVPYRVIGGALVPMPSLLMRTNSSKGSAPPARTGPLL